MSIESHEMSIIKQNPLQNEYFVKTCIMFKKEFKISEMQSKFEALY